MNKWARVPSTIPDGVRFQDDLEQGYPSKDGQYLVAVYGGSDYVYYALSNYRSSLKSFDVGCVLAWQTVEPYDASYLKDDGAVEVVA